MYVKIMNNVRKKIQLWKGRKVKTLSEDIKSGNFKNAYLICGEEEYLKLNYKNQMIKAIAGDDTIMLIVREGCTRTSVKQALAHVIPNINLIK